ncbi:MAG: 4-hydroxy-3-methylbut-2-enyl diphosphate reductase [Bacteroidales bacterium]|nr:4-hydroxy-3-methylbut-2-enyl diphosphate reductase [Bacteroidales bacterium]
MLVTIDGNAGFCFGVVNAIQTAEQELQHHGSLFCLGDIVHNNAEVQRLATLGLKVIDYHTFATLPPGSRVLIRAHGEPPSTYLTARQRNITLVDATCPIVLALQKKIRQGYLEMQQRGGQVVIFGKPGHAEVVGLCGQAEGNAIVVDHPDHLDGITPQRPIRLYSQTTKSKDEYNHLIQNLQLHIKNSAGTPDFIAHDTLCRRVANRASQLKKFATSVDVLLFVCGEGSSNGHYLYEYCKKVQPRTYLIAGTADYQPAWTKGASHVGISGATSTPMWLMQQVKNLIN